MWGEVGWGNKSQARSQVSEEVGLGNKSQKDASEANLAAAKANFLRRFVTQKYSFF